MLAKSVSETRVTTSKVMEPTDANFLGKVFGGSILSMLDLVAYATASRFAENICVTASFDRVDFHQPIDVGEMVTCEGFVTFVGTTSVEVTVEVYAENLLAAAARRHTNTARITMVAIKDGKPVAVPRLVCESREERVRFLEGKLRRELRGVQRELLATHLAKIEGLSDDRIQELLEGKDMLTALNT